MGQQQFHCLYVLHTGGIVRWRIIVVAVLLNVGAK